MYISGSLHCPGREKWSKKHRQILLPLLPIYKCGYRKKGANYFVCFDAGLQYMNNRNGCFSSKLPLKIVKKVIFEKRDFEPDLRDVAIVTAE
jgi:hypothetical protein